ARPRAPPRRAARLSRGFAPASLARSSPLQTPPLFRSPQPCYRSHCVILQPPLPGGCELWINSPENDAFSLFHQLREHYLLPSSLGQVVPPICGFSSSRGSCLNSLRRQVFLTRPWRRLCDRT